LDFQCFFDTLKISLAENILELDSAMFSQLLVKSKLKMQVVQYGYALNNEELNEKFGVNIYSGGCVFDPSEFEKQYSRFMRRLLVIRNGDDWEEKHKKELRQKR